MQDMKQSDKQGKKAGPLAGIRILDAATFLAAPLAASLLSEYGAEVIKVEQPSGDWMRNIGPFRGDVSVWWKVIARNRRSVALDLNSEVGRGVFKQLASQCDVVIMNYRPAALKKWGLEFDDLVKCRKDIIYYHLTTFGAGPYEQRPGFARVAEAFAGLTNRTGFPGQPPVQSGYAMLGDGIAGIHGAFALMLALRQRDLTGEPQMIDLGIYEPMLSDDGRPDHQLRRDRFAHGAHGQFQPTLVAARPVPDQGRPVRRHRLLDGKAVAATARRDGRRIAGGLRQRQPPARGPPRRSSKGASSPGRRATSCASCSRSAASPAWPWARSIRPPRS